MASEAPLVEIAVKDLRPGLLGATFSAGCHAVVVRCDGEFRQIWQNLMENPLEQLPWQGSLLDIARNHKGGSELGDQLGDMFHFIPGSLAYIARKFELQYDPTNNRIEATPRTFLQGNSSYSIADKAIELCWQFCERIMLSVVPTDRHAPPWKAVVHRLKYQGNKQDNQQLYALASHSVGKWAQLGCRLDARREETWGPLNRKGLADIFALISLAAPLRPLFDSFNAQFKRYDYQHTVPEGVSIIGKPHYDDRYFSALSGDRSNIATEILVGKNWVHLPIDMDCVVVLPGLLAEKKFGLRPMLHRVIQLDAVNGDGAIDNGQDVTLLFGAK
jgi:hypothetical protein